MGSALPDGDIAPVDGRLPESVVLGATERALGAYVHIPFCRVRCGYCDFNTYTASELRGVSQADYLTHLLAEMDIASRVLAEAGLPDRPLGTVFFGGGTPTLLPAEHLVAALQGLRSRFGLTADVEVTVEANPDTVDSEYFEQLRDAGFTRVSFGVQSAVPHVLSTLDRTHDPDAVPFVVQAARDAGLAVSVDLIYGTPGESLSDWDRSIDLALSLETDHISAYALIVEEGTALARQINRGEISAPDDDLQAAMYERADARFRAAGLNWYEVSNWSRSTETRSAHNRSYWTGEDWWGFGPGAHSHVGGVRWWNVKHPAAYAERLRSNSSPAHAREILTAADISLEELLLKSRLVEGFPSEKLDHNIVESLVNDGHLDAQSAQAGRVVLTLRGRLLADEVVRRLSSD